jgi:hypothetical protein
MARRRDLTAAFYARKCVAAQGTLARMTPTPHPRASLQVYSVDQVSSTRRVGCLNYGVCLDLAFASRWDGFSCDGCKAFVLPNREDFMADLEGLTLLLAAVVKRQPLFLEEEEVQVCTFE